MSGMTDHSDSDRVPEPIVPAQRGPSFTSPDAEAAQAADIAWRTAHPGQRLPRVEASHFAAPQSKTPVIVTAVVVALVAVVVGAATWIAHIADRSVQAAPPPSAAPAQPTPTGDGSAIEFTSMEGSGKLVIVGHEWVSDSSSDAEFGHYLQIEVELSATDGRISYDPYFFQAFDADGNLFDTNQTAAQSPMLGGGTLRPGESVRGVIAFDIPRGDITLLMSNELYESVTALKIRN